MRVLVYMYMCKVYVFICVNICMQVYAYIYACTCMGKYVRVCMGTHVNVCEGPYHPLRFGRRGCCFYKIENTESDWYTSPYGLVDLQLPHSSDRGYHIPLSVSVTGVAFCSSLTTSTLVPNPITTDSYFLTQNGPTSNTYAKVT